MKGYICIAAQKGLCSNFGLNGCSHAKPHRYCNGRHKVSEDKENRQCIYSLLERHKYHEVTLGYGYCIRCDFPEEPNDYMKRLGI